MNNKEIISILTDIESSVDVNNLTYKDVCVWPYIRNQIATHLGNKDIECSSQNTNNKKTSAYLASIIKKITMTFGLLIKNPGNKKLTQNDVVFLARTSERINLVKGKWYNTHADSFSDCLGEKYSIQRLEFSDDGRVSSPQFSASYHLDFYLFINLIKFKLIKHFLTGRIQNFHILKNYLERVDIFLPFSEKSLRLRIALILSQKKIFSRIIRKCRPKLFFLVCYYYDIAMAAILSCHEHGIPVVEFQHGAQNDYNLYLTHWSQIPRQGYQLLPDFFWNWGEASANRINKWAMNTVTHKAFVGGNLWISKWVNKYFQTDDCNKYDVQNIFPKGYKHILVSLQVWPDHFPVYLSDIIRNSSPEWFWHIRQHPRHRVPSEDLEKIFISLPNVQIEEHYSREMPLYLLLQHIDLHLTGFSTVAFEAAQFGVPTIFFHRNAKDGFRGMFDNRLLFFAQNQEEMLKVIKEILGKEVNSSYRIPYITVDPQNHIFCMEKMIVAAKRRKKTALLERFYPTFPLVFCLRFSLMKLAPIVQ